MRRATTGFANRYGRELMRLPLRIPNAVELSDFLFIRLNLIILLLSKVTLLRFSLLSLPRGGYFLITAFPARGIFTVTFFWFCVSGKKR